MNYKDWRERLSNEGYRVLPKAMHRPLECFSLSWVHFAVFWHICFSAGLEV